MQIKQDDHKYIMNTYGRFDVEIESGNGSILNGDKEYIDFGSGIAVNTFGAKDKEWVSAVYEQLNKIAHTSNLYYTEPCVKLAKMLCEKTGFSKVFFSNSGAEANECAIKAARKYGTDKDPEKNVIITMRDSFHGRTVTTLSATGQDVFHKNFTPFTEGFVYVTPENFEELDKAIEENNATAIMLETIQGEGGIKVISEEYLKYVEKKAKENDMLFIIDEVQTGNGRTGKLYSYMNYDLHPDIITTAKGLGGGLPIGATLFSEKVSEILPKGSHGSTFGGNPVCAAGAVNILSRLSDEFLDTVREKGEYIKEKVKGFKKVADVCGKGLMIGIKTETAAAEIATKCAEKGLLVLTAKDKVRLLPALNISYEEIDKGLSILKEVVEE